MNSTRPPSARAVFCCGGCALQGYGGGGAPQGPQSERACEACAPLAQSRVRHNRGARARQRGIGVRLNWG
eukprot:12749379-Alexandrium_andersonii.AAC.1